MTREDTLKIMSVLKAAYPNYYKDMKKGEAVEVDDEIVCLLNIQ